MVIDLIERIRFAFDKRNPHSLIGTLETLSDGSILATLSTIPLGILAIVFAGISAIIKWLIPIHWIGTVFVLPPVFASLSLMFMCGAIMTGAILILSAFLPLLAIVNIFYSLLPHCEITALKITPAYKKGVGYYITPVIMCNIGSFMCHTTFVKSIGSDVFNTLHMVLSILIHSFFWLILLSTYVC